MGIRKSDTVKKPADKKLNKSGSVVLLSLLCIVMAFVLVMSFLRFPIGVQDYNSVLGAVKLDYDIAGGTSYTLTLAKDNLEEIEDINGVLDTLNYRMSELGYKNYSIKALKSTEKDVEDYEIRIAARTTDSLASDIAVVAAYGEIAVYGGTSQNPTTQILTEKQAIANATYNGAYTGTDGTTYYQVGILFTDYGYNEIKDKIQEASTAEGSKDFYLEIKLGDTVLLSGTSALTMQSFSGKTLGIISSTEASAKQMALQIRTGGLAYKYDISEGVAITSPYGTNVDLKCVIAISSLLVLLMVAFIILYKGYGIGMSLSLLAFMLIEVCMLIAVPGVVLSLGGVIGIALSTIVTAICLMITANKLKAELKNTEKTVKAATKKSYKDALLPIVNLLVSGGIVSVLFLIFASGAAYGFAVTFGIGVITGAITSLVLSRMFSALLFNIADYNEKFIGVKREEA